MDPLIHLLKTNPPDFSLIRKEVNGEMYHAVMLQDGRIGVCATLGTQDRIRLIAYYNALFNSLAVADACTDIFDHIDFRTAGDIVMIGFFRPLVKKLDTLGVPLSIFDLRNDDPRLMPYEQLDHSLSIAKTAIITSTTLSNGTYESVIQKLNPAADAYMLGPSTIMHAVMFSPPQVKAIYGMSIPPDEMRVLDVIANNGGTPDFSPFARKICMLRSKI